MSLALRPYQQTMVSHVLQHRRSALFAGMGLGKTVTCLAAIDALMRLGEVNRVLILAPLRVARFTWPEETSKWPQFKHLRITPIVGTAAERKRALASCHETNAIATINYENVPWLVDELGDDWPFDMLIADELTRLKSFRLRQGGKRAQALAHVAMNRVKRFIGLTGTPAPNGLADLWGQVWFIDCGQRLGRTYGAFTSRWFKPGPGGFGIVQLPHAQDEIQARIRDVCLSVDPADHFDLEDPIVNVVKVDLPRAARGTYNEMLRQFITSLNGETLTAANAAARSMKLLQLANGAAYVDEDRWEQANDAKLDALESIVAEANGMPLLVCYHFKSDLQRLLARFPQGRHLDQKLATMAEFKAGRIPILFMHPASAGHGIDGFQNVTNQIVFFGHWWALEEREQAIARIGPVRQAQAGHRRPVFVHNIVARDTVDELVLQRHATKASVQEILLSAMKDLNDATEPA